jgi:glutamyl-tRNA synthetase
MGARSDLNSQTNPRNNTQTDSLTETRGYRGRIAPSPTGYLHLGHASTFWTAFERARDQAGVLIFRNEDLDPQRCRKEFAQAMAEDLRWFGIAWQEGPEFAGDGLAGNASAGNATAGNATPGDATAGNVFVGNAATGDAAGEGGAFGPYAQSERRGFYLDAWHRLREGGWIYPCTCSRRELAMAASAPHDDDDEPVYPGTCRERRVEATAPAGVNWRFRVPDGECIEFVDGRLGKQRFEVGRDFGDFAVWRRDDVPAYQLAVVVDDSAMRVSEVVRGEDLLRSTARQILLQRALGLPTPEYYHCALLTDESGVRLAKRHDALSLRTLRAQGYSAEEVRAMAGWKKSAEAG